MPRQYKGVLIGWAKRANMKTEATQNAQPPAEGNADTSNQDTGSPGWHEEILRSRAGEFLDRGKWLTINEVKLALAHDRAEIYRVVKERENQPTVSMDETLKRLGLSQNDL